MQKISLITWAILVEGSLCVWMTTTCLLNIIWLLSSFKSQYNKHTDKHNDNFIFWSCNQFSCIIGLCMTISPQTKKNREIQAVKTKILKWIHTKSISSERFHLIQKRITHITLLVYSGSSIIFFSDLTY